MNIIGTALMMAALVVTFLGSVLEKNFRREELANHKIAAYLSFDGGYVKQIYADEFYLGSGKNADVRVPFSAAGVAPIHAYIYREGEYFHIQNVANDLPVYVKCLNEEKKIGQGENGILRNGSKIRIGSCTILFKRGVK